MPRQDQTGPEGKGPRTGRGLGNCQPSQDTQSDDVQVRPQGRGLGRGQGRGLGRSRRQGQLDQRN